MNQHIQDIWNLVQQDDRISGEQKDAIFQSLKEADKEMGIISFKLDRTEKVKRTTAILLEETIEELEKKRKAVEETNAALEKSMDDLKATQSQLIHAEKMASLGELTAGIAHEIQNPLNFVNNFSEVSVDLVEELYGEMENGDAEEVKAIAGDLKQNLEKIVHHGKRASGIVNGMLQHSRAGSGEKAPTDINALADEYLRLAYHGLRAKDQSFNAGFRLDADESLPKANVVPQDIGRVLLNLINNAFYACAERRAVGKPLAADGSRRTVSAFAKASADKSFKPLVVVSTRQVDNLIEIRVQDNGPGIPDEIRDKIFQPFFTTKPTGQGTGLGLSMSYDIITKGHGGNMTVETKTGEGSSFILSIPLDTSKLNE